MNDKLNEIFFPNYVKRCKMITGSKKNFCILYNGGKWIKHFKE